MASTIEKSYGARLRKLQDAVEFIKGWTGYAPPRTEESVTELTALIESIKQINVSETAKQSTYSNAVEKRQNLFNKKEGSIEKLLVPIRAAVEAQFGKQSSAAKQVGSIIATMRKSKLIKLPTDPANPTVTAAVSQSEKSYGSRTQYFTDIATTLNEIPDYTSSNALLTKEGLQTKIEELHEANNAVASELQGIRSIRKTRTDNYNELAERMKRVKAYTKSQYGINSPEFKSLIALGI